MSRLKQLLMLLAAGTSVLTGTFIYANSAPTGDLDSPFGFHPAGVFKPGYPDNGYSDATHIGVKWAREGVYAFWFLIQPDLDQPVYDFTLYDQQWSNVPTNLRILANIAPQGPIDEGRCLPGSWLPVDEAQYTAFVRATVERYDGDNVEDMPGLANPIRHWQVGNEPNETFAPLSPGQVRSDFAGLQRITYQAIKQACADCTVLIGGVAGFPENYVANFQAFYAPILAQLAGQYVDTFDFHWYGTADGEYRLRDTVSGQDVLDHIRAALTANGFPADLPIWITEMGSYSGDPTGPGLPSQTERQQAGDYFKRYVYSLSRGVHKIFSAFGLMEGFKHDGGYFDHTGLIYDGEDTNDLGLGVKKLSYYTYKKMTEQLEGADWSSLTALHDGTDSDHLYLFRVVKAGRPIHIAWWDYFDEPGYTPGDTKPVTLTGLSSAAVTVTTVVPTAALGRDVADYATAFTVTAHLVSDGSVTIPLGEDPMIVEETEPPASQCVQDVNANGRGDIVDIQGTAAAPGCHVYLPLVVVNWRQPWPVTTPTPTPSPTPAPSDLTFVSDPGLRVDYASNPAPSVDPETGTVYLFYEDHSTGPGRSMVATSSDGLSFTTGRLPTEADNPHHPFHVRLPDGTWRKYLFDQAAGEFRSQSSTDGIHYTPDPGTRYTLQPADNGTAGIHDEYVDPAGGVVLLYIGDMYGLNNVRRAYSPPGDNGWAFTYEDGNVLGDAGAGGGPNSYVDQKSILLPDGRRRLFTMKQGAVYSFISSDGKNYVLEPGVRLSPSDLTEVQVRSLHDPVVVLLPDGRYRMYVAAAVDDGSGGMKWAIVSATAGAES